MRLTIRQNITLVAKILAACASRAGLWKHLRKVSRDVLFESDTTTIRIILANASLLWAIALLVNPQVFGLPSYAVMRAVGGAPFWVFVFVLHFVGVYWRTFDPKPRIVWGLIVNGYGFMIWFFTTVSLNFYLGGISPGTSLELVMCGASAWALYKTGFSHETISP